MDNVKKYPVGTTIKIINHLCKSCNGRVGKITRSEITYAVVYLPDSSCCKNNPIFGWKYIECINTRNQQLLFDFAKE